MKAQGAKKVITLRVRQHKLESNLIVTFSRDNGQWSDTSVYNAVSVMRGVEGGDEERGRGRERSGTWAC